MHSLIMEILLQSTTKKTSKLITSEGPCSLQNAKMSASQIEGVFDVEENHVLGLIKVEHDQDRLTLAQIRRIVNKAGTEQRIGAKNLWGVQITLWQ
jgi:hypothetical protein